LLSDDELHIALKHELAHIHSGDNFKKLLFRFCPFPGMDKLEKSWSQAAELAADDAAVSTSSDAVELASALVKLSRLVPVETAPICTVGFVTGTIGARVARLLAWDQASKFQPVRILTWYVVPPALVTLFCVLAGYGAVLSFTHEITEWLVR
jgi:Zn-dependent protease with chaperone function